MTDANQVWLGNIASNFYVKLWKMQNEDFVGEIALKSFNADWHGQSDGVSSVAKAGGDNLATRQCIRIATLPPMHEYLMHGQKMVRLQRSEGCILSSDYRHYHRIPLVAASSNPTLRQKCELKGDYLHCTLADCFK